MRKFVIGMILLFGLLITYSWAYGQTYNWVP